MISDLIDILVSESRFDIAFGPTVVGEVLDNIEYVPATRHPLGFVHFDLTKLVALPPSGFARLHVWDKTLAPPDPAGNIHDHSWDLTSAILAGALRDRTFMPVPTPNGSLSAVRVNYGVTNNFFPAGKYELSKLTDATYSKGDVYNIRSRIVHESEPVNHPTVTLVVGLPDADAATNGPLILSRSSRSPEGTPKRECLDTREARRVLEDVRAFI